MYLVVLLALTQHYLNRNEGKTSSECLWTRNRTGYNALMAAASACVASAPPLSRLAFQDFLLTILKYLVSSSV